MKNAQKIVCAALVACAAFSVSAQPYPAKPVRLVVPYPPGAALDFLARAMNPKLSESLGVSVVVENKAGASGAIGSELLAKSAPDGYTIGLGNPSTHSLPIALGKKVGYDPIRDFTPLGVLVKNILTLAVNPQLPVRSVSELVDYARKNPGKVSFSSPGSGTSPHLIGELLNQIAATDMVHIAYRGGGPAFTDLLNGQVPIAFAATATVMPHVKNGRARVLAVFDDVRYGELPDVPTGGEALEGFAPKASWTGMFGPRGLPAPVVSRLNAELLKAIRLPEVRALLEANGSQVLGTAPEELGKFIANDIELWTRVVKARNIRAD